MSWSDRRAFLALLIAAPAAACGFVPAYGPSGPARALDGQIGIDDPADKNGFDLVGRLQERLGRAQAPAWRLSYTISVYEAGLGITLSNTTTRYDVIGSVSYSLRPAGDDQIVASGTVKNFTSYSASGTVVSTSTSERDAYQRLMRMLADQIVTDLIASSGGWAQK